MILACCCLFAGWAPAATPDAVPGLALWLKADEGITKSEAGRVAAWADRSGQQRDAKMDAAARQPHLIPKLLNGHAVIRFNGEAGAKGTYLRIPELPNARTLFLVLRTTAGNRSNAVLGHETLGDVPNRPFVGGLGTLFSGFANQNIQKGKLYVNGEETPVLAARQPAADFVVLTVDPAGPVATPLNVIAMQKNTHGYGDTDYWCGDIAEVVIYDQPLAAEQRQGIEQYLREKYLEDDPNAPGAFHYTTPEGIAYLITSDGLSAVKQGDTLLGSGCWRAMLGMPFEQTLTKVSATEARVVQGSAQAEVTYTYTFDGEDLAIKAYVQSRIPDHTLPKVTFGAFTVHFSKAPEGWMARDNGKPDAWHPGFHNRIGGSYATDGQFGIGLTPRDTGMTRSLISWAGDTFTYGNEKALPAGGARTYGFALHVSKNTDWRHLLEPYKRHFSATWGPQRYQSDHRFVVQSTAGAEAWRNAKSPLGYEQNRRLDLPEGMAKFAQWTVERLQQGGGQGVIVWAHDGAHPRGALYRTDFDILPEATERNWPTLRAAYDQAGLRLGVATRPGEVCFRSDWASDGTFRLSADDPAHAEQHLRRFKSMLDKGCTFFYLDTFGDTLDDVKLMMKYRELLGDKIQTYVEHPCDAILPYSGAYMECNYTGDTDPEKAYDIMWGIHNWWAYARYLLPDVGSVVMLRKAGPKEAETMHEWLFRHHYTPLCQDWNYGLEPAQLKLVQQKYVTEDGKWKQ
jgi:hypothetical protein